MDEHNVHNFWGTSPFIDFGRLVLDTREKATEISLENLSLESQKPMQYLQVGALDCRHTVATMCRAHRHGSIAQAPLHFYVYETEPEVLARHILLISVLLDEEYPVRDRVEMFLEVHGNALLSERTAAYLEARAKHVEDAIMTLNSGEEVANGIGSMLDISLLKYEERDLVADALRKTNRKVEYDMAKSWDARLRRNLGERYDHRRNMADWDYHMRLQREQKDGIDSGKNSIIHFSHFREWRLHGIAYELRDVVYKEVNRSLLSTAYGRTKEFKDRNGQDRGRSVSAWGYWGDVISTPYHSFGTVSEESKFFKVANKAYTYTSVDIAQFNVTAFLHELRTSRLHTVPEGEEAPRAEASRGVTSQEMMEKATQWTGEGRDMASLQEQEREAERQLDIAAQEKCRNMRIHLVSGDLKRTITGRKKFSTAFDCIFVGAHSVHLLEAAHQLRNVAKPGAPLAVETAEHLLFLNAQAVKEFNHKVKEFASSSGWEERERPGESLPNEDLLFRAPKQNAET